MTGKELLGFVVGTLVGTLAIMGVAYLFTAAPKQEPFWVYECDWKRYDRLDGNGMRTGQKYYCIKRDSALVRP